jgi:hypothetical protein
LTSIDSSAIRDSYATHQFQIAVRMGVPWHLTSNAVALPPLFIDGSGENERRCQKATGEFSAIVEFSTESGTPR